MFGRRRRMWPRRHYGGGSGLGMVLLGMQFLNLFNYFSRNEILPVTLGVVALNVVAFFQPNIHSVTHMRWPSLAEACISAQKVWFQKQWKRVFMAPFFHSGDMHLYFNMASFIWKGISLEKYFGSTYFLYMITVFSVATNLVYVAINLALAELLDQWSFVQSCAVGFSGVIFALKVVTTHLEPAGMTRVMGMIPVPMRLACWVELILISVLFPNVSFVGHLSGILVGLAFISGPLRAIMDLPLSFLNGMKVLALPYKDVVVSGEYLTLFLVVVGALLLLAYYLVDMVPVPGQRRADGRSYTYRAATTGHRPPETESRPTDSQPRRRENPSQRNYSSYTYAAGATGYGNQREDLRGETADHRHLEDTGLQEAIRRSLEDSRTAVPSAPPPVTTENDADMQLALERSAADASDSDGTRQQETAFHSREGLQDDTVEHHPSGPESYGFRVSELQSSETVPVGSREDTAEDLRTGEQSRVLGTPDSVRRRHIGLSTGGSLTDSSQRDSTGVAGQETAVLSREAVRAARLQRLAGGTSPPGSRKPLNAISASMRSSPLNKK